MKIKFLLVFIVLMVLLSALPDYGFAMDENVQSGRIGEGKDFATLVFRNPWDMDTYTDISQWINHAGSSNFINDINVTQGVFSGTASGDYSEFYVLFPGYQPGMYEPGTGVLTPIPSNQYQCFYMAMKVDIPETTQYSWNIGWVEDRTIDWGSGDWGKTFPTKVINNQWVLYKKNLNDSTNQVGDIWSSLSHWQGIRITPILSRPGTTFHVDWVRLTDCTPVYYPITGLSTGVFSIWIDTGSPARQVRVKENVTPDGNGIYQWDVQGLEAGEYQYFVKNSTGGTVTQGILTIDPAPIPTFTNPSPFSGVDYSTSAGNSWDMRDNKDVGAVDCTNYAILNDILYLDTPSTKSLPSDCVGSQGEADSKIYLNTPIKGDISQYRYLSFRHDLDGSWSMPDKGMVIRWIWEISGLAPKPCKYVSREIALEVFWDTYWVDLHNPRNGTPIEVGGLNASSCPFPVQWKTQPGSLSQFRLDPNENIFSSTMHQEFDWIRLTKVPSVMQGVPFTIQVSMNKSPSAIRSIKFYYTTDTKQPKQNLAHGSPIVANQHQDNMVTSITESSTKIFIPVVLNRYAPPVELPQVENDVRFSWDTDSVAPGEYYICAVTEDEYNTTTLCSEVPVLVTP